MSDTGYPSEPFPEEDPAARGPAEPASPSSFSSSDAVPPPTAAFAPETPPVPGVSSPPIPPPTVPTLPPAPAPLLPPPMPAVAYAGFWIRFVAWILDAFILYIVGMGTNALMRIAAGVPVTPIWTASRGATFASNCAESLVGVIVWWVYYATCESSPGEATPGKRALRLRVTDLQGRRISFARATGRTFAKVLSFATLFVGFFMAGFTGRRQALHDLIAETVVLRDLR